MRYANIIFPENFSCNLFFIQVCSDVKGNSLKCNVYVISHHNVWTSQYVIITECEHHIHNMWSSKQVAPNLHMKLPRQCVSTTHTCDLLWYCQDMINVISRIKTIAIITQTHVIIQNVIISCDHTMMWIRPLGLAAIRKYDKFCHVHLWPAFEMRWS